MQLNHQQCYDAVTARDRRYDGQFVTAVRTTGVYCRPSCPARTPYAENVEFHPTAASAQCAGYRSCKRCRPDATPGGPRWAAGDGLAGRAMALIDSGELTRTTVTELARRLHVSVEQLDTDLRIELGADSTELDAAQRARTARLLLESTDLALPDIAAASGYCDAAALEAATNKAFATPTAKLRSARKRDAAPMAPGEFRIPLPVRLPFDFADALEYLRVRHVRAFETVTDSSYTRTIQGPHGPALATVTAGRAGLTCEVRLTETADLTAVLASVRRLFDLDADPVGIDNALSRDTALAELVAARPGLRSPGAVDGFEIAIRGIIGQQISVAAARTRLEQIVSDYGSSAFDDDDLLMFPTPAALADADPTALRMPRSRAQTLIGVAQACASGELDLSAAAARDETREALLAMKGIGPWTADYILMRLGDPDILLATDLGIIKSAVSNGIELTDARTDLSPWRSYLSNHLWAAH
jgi:AraC family transcriptional regulator, regulatory protein of adaptative response / DNA-3-methyladenine glycosylase II